MTSAVDEITGAFRAAVTQPYQLAVQVDSQIGGLTTATDLQIAPGGQITADRTAAARRTIRLRIVGVPTGLLPRAGQKSPLDCYGNELVVASGVTYPGGRRELIRQGVFRIASSLTVDTVDGITVDLTGTDRAGWLNKLRLLTPWQTPAGSTATGAITALAVFLLGPSVEIVDLSSRGAVDLFPQHLLVENTNPWTDGFVTWAEAVGAEVYFDRHGRLVIRDIANYAVTPAAWQMVEGPGCTVVELDTAQDDSAPNAFVAIGETPDSAAVRAYAIDDDPASPTYYGPDIATPLPGGYGPRPTSLQSSLITSQAQAQAVADAQGLLLFGGTEKATVTVAPNPAIVEGDVLHIRRARSGVDDMYVVDQLPIPLSGESGQRLVCTLIRSGSSG